MYEVKPLNFYNLGFQSLLQKINSYRYNKAAMEAGGAAVLAANPNLLVVVDALYYGRDLTEATGAGEIALPGGGDSLVYAVHDYSW